MTLDAELYIAIPGHPKPKGSLRPVRSGGKGRILLVEDNRGSKPWRDAVALWCRKRWHLRRSAPGQPVGAEITFTLPRPKSHYGTGRNEQRVKPSAPAHPTSQSSYDLDKLVRLVLDALQDVDTIPNDAAVVEIEARKCYPASTELDKLGDVLPYPGVVIRLYPIGDPES